MKQASSPETEPRRLGVEVYKQICGSAGIKPNAQILSQIDAADIGLMNVTRIDCSKTFLGSLGVKVVLRFVDMHQHIEELDISANSIEGDTVTLLCDVASRHQNLRYISIAGNTLSTPSARLLWELAKSSERIESIVMERTGLTDEWVARIQRHLEANEAFQNEGFVPHGIPRPVFEWTTAFVCCVGSVPLISEFTSRMIPGMTKMLSRFRVRLAAIVIDESAVDEDAELTLSKLNLCNDKQNQMLPWVLGLFDGGIGPRARTVLQKAVFESSREDIPPLKNKQGIKRDAVFRSPRSVLLGFLRSEAELREDIELSVEQKESADLAKTLKQHPCATVFTAETMPELELCAYSSLYGSVETAYRTPPGQLTVPLTEEDTALDEAMWHFCELRAQFGIEGVVSGLLGYIERPAAPAAFPLVTYAGSGSGRAASLAATCIAARQLPNHRVIPYVVTESHSRSLTVFLWFLLDQLGYRGSRAAASMEVLMAIVNQQLTDYPPEAPQLDIVIFSTELLESITGSASTLGWLPYSLPPNVRTIISVSTDSPLLVSLRKRSPQPYELLMSSLQPHLHLQALLRDLELHPVLGINATACDPAFIYEEKGVIAVPQDPVHALLFKEESDLTLFMHLIPPLFRIDKASQVASEAQVLQYIASEVPETVEAIVQRMLSSLSTPATAETMKMLLMVFAATPVTIPDAIAICEGILGAKRFSALPVLVTLMEHRLIVISPQGPARFIHDKVARGCAAFYGEVAIDQGVVTLTHHMLQEIQARTSSLPLAFRVVPQLLLRSGQYEILRELLTDPSLFDALLQYSGMRVYIVDALYRQLHHMELAEELRMENHLQFCHEGAKHFLMESILQVTQLPNNAYQASLLLRDDSLLFQRAAAQRAAYPVLVPKNKYNCELTSIASAKLPTAVRHCSMQSESFVVTEVSGDLSVLSSTGEILARGENLSTEEILGAHIVNETVIVITRPALVLWNYTNNRRQVLPDLTCSLSARVLNKDRTLCVVVESSGTEAVSILDVHRGRVLSTLPERVPVREAKYAGDSVMVISIYDIYLANANYPTVQLEHNGVIHAATSTTDGKIIASAVGNTLWLWSANGDCMHILTSTHSSPINDLVFHPNGSLLATCDRSGRVVLTISLNGSSLAEFETGVGHCADYLLFSNDGTKLIGRCGTFLRMWDGTTFEERGAVNAHNGNISRLTVAPGSNQFVSVCSVGEVKLWSLSRGFPSVPLSMDRLLTSDISKYARVSKHRVHDAVMDADRRFVAALHAEESPAERFTLQVLPLSGGTATWTSQRIDGMVRYTDSTLFIIQGRRVACMQMATGEVLFEMPLPADVDVDSSWLLRMSDDKQFLMCASMSRIHVRIYVFAIPARKCTAMLVGHTNDVLECYFTPDSLQSISTDGTFRLWSKTSFAEQSSYTHSTKIVAACRIGVNESIFCDENGAMVRVELLKKLIRAHEMATYPDVIPKLCQCIGNNLVGVIAQDASLYIFDTEEMAYVNRIASRQFTCLASSPPPLKRLLPMVITGTEDGDVFLNDLREGESESAAGKPRVAFPTPAS